MILSTDCKWKWSVLLLKEHLSVGSLDQLHPRITFNLPFTSLQSSAVGLVYVAQ